MTHPPSSTASSTADSYELPLHGACDPSSSAQGTTPGSFARRADIGGAYAFSSPDTPGMPSASEKTAWDFLPHDWSCSSFAQQPAAEAHASDCVVVDFVTARGVWMRVRAPKNFVAITQLERARLGVVTKEMERVAAREPHLTPLQVRDEIAAGRMVIPANRVHLAHKLDPMAIGRASKTKINANMGASPISSGTHEEVEKLQWAEKWGADTVMDLSTGGNLDECREALCLNSTVPIGTVPIYSMIIGKKLEDLNEEI
ncbi:MAG: thiamine biosynthesis protein ThiC, partial [Planctomycetota bacterium]